MDAIFKQIYRERRFNILPQLNPPLLIELVGPPEERLLQLSQAVKQVESGVPYPAHRSSTPIQQTLQRTLILEAASYSSFRMTTLSSSRMSRVA